MERPLSIQRVKGLPPARTRFRKDCQLTTSFTRDTCRRGE